MKACRCMNYIMYIHTHIIPRLYKRCRLRLMSCLKPWACTILGRPLSATYTKIFCKIFLSKIMKRVISYGVSAICTFLLLHIALFQSWPYITTWSRPKKEEEKKNLIMIRSLSTCWRQPYPTDQIYDYFYFSRGHIISVREWIFYYI